MSPTSSQAAPPRTSTISDARVSVKPPRTDSAFYVSGRERLPLVVSRVLERRNSRRIGMHVNDACTRLLRAQYDAVVLRHPVRRPSHWVRGNLAQIARLHQILQRLRGRLLVQSEIINRLAHHHQILM